MSLHFLFTMLLLYTISSARGLCGKFVAVHSVGVGDSTTLDATASPKIYLFALCVFNAVLPA